jgi:hypothetical protein
MLRRPGAARQTAFDCGQGRSGGLVLLKRIAASSMTTNVLILCTHNSARSVLGEGMLNHWAKKLGKDVGAFSAGSAPSGYPDPSNAAAADRATAFELTRQAIGYRMLQLLQLPLDALGDAELRVALSAISST